MVNDSQAYRLVSPLRSLPARGVRWLLGRVPYFKGRNRMARLCAWLTLPRANLVLKHVNG